jgi:hypothetical protein
MQLKINKFRYSGRCRSADHLNKIRGPRFGNLWTTATIWWRKALTSLYTE